MNIATHKTIILEVKDMIWKCSQKGFIVGLVLLMSILIGFGCDSETEEDATSSDVYYVSNQGDDDDDGHD